MLDNQKSNKSSVSIEKTELAKKIAKNSAKVKKSYDRAENSFIFFIRGISSFFNKIIFNSKFYRVSALVLAIIIYFAVNNTSSTIGISQSATLTHIPVEAVYNGEVYEVEGIPEYVNVIVSGEMSEITFQKSKTNSAVIADLSGLTEGNYTIKLVPTNFSNELEVNVLETPSVNVKISKKITTKFDLSYEYINTNQMDAKFALSAPVFSSSEALIRASEDTINKIAFVKALIDCSGVNDSFTSMAKIVAYDDGGLVVNCDIIPETVEAKVTVSTNSKKVPIVVTPIGNLAKNLSIDSIVLDQETVEIYGQPTNLAQIDAIYVSLDVNNISANTSLSMTIDKPTGINKMSVSRVNLKLNVAKTITKTIANVPAIWINYNSAYNLTIVNSEDALVDVVVSGTQNNIDKVTVESITAVIDLAGYGAGIHDVPLKVSGANNLVNYSSDSKKNTIRVNLSLKK